MARRQDRFVSEKLSPLERQAVVMLLSGRTCLEVMKATGLSLPEVEAARTRQFHQMSRR